MKNLNAENYQRFRDENIVVLKAESDSCGPCKMMAPIMDQIEQDNLGKVPFYTVNAESEPGILGANGVQSLPTILFFKKGQVVHRMQGVSSKAAVQHAVDVLVKKA